MSAVIDRAGQRISALLPSRLVARVGQMPGVEKALLFLYCGILFFAGINTGCFYRTEGLRALVAAESLRTGNWLVPTLYGEPLLTKPPGHYAAIALASLPTGRVTEWSARLPSSVAACAIVLLFYSWFARELGRRAGFIAALIVPASVAWFERVPSAEIDMVHLAWVVAALYCGYRATASHEPAARPTGSPWWLAALLCTALGVLTKWTTPLFFYGTLLPFLWWRGRLRVLLSLPHLASVALACSIVVAWIVAVAWLVGGDRLLATLGQEALPKFLPGLRPAGYPWREMLLLPLRQLVANLPWTACALIALSPRLSANWSQAEKRLLLFFHCWLWPNLAFWSLVPNHAPRHSLAVAPAVAGLAALVWIQWSRAQLRWPFHPISAAQALAAIIVCMLIAKTCFLAVILPERTRARQPQKTGEVLANVVPPDATLHLFGLKDEGVLFYYGRPVCRLPDPSALLSQDELLYCIITEPEWRQWHTSTRGETLAELHDEQGALLLLVRMRFDPSRRADGPDEARPAERTAVW
jgi:4-amino-4-deoxy-L-arabinose transferase-like glycosyltransferase